MKKCTYCGRENPDDAVNCSGCGTDEFEGDTSPPAENLEDPDDLVTLTTCQNLAEADLVHARLEAAGIEAFLPDEENVGLDLNTYGYVQVQVRRQDYPAAKELQQSLPKSDPTPPDPQLAVPGGKKVIASLAMGQLLDIMERLRKEAIPAEIRTTPQASGLDICEIVVDDADFDRGCDVVEAWDAEQQAALKRRSRICCNRCGSRNYEQIPHDKLGSVYQCKDCGNEFIS